MKKAIGKIVDNHISNKLKISITKYIDNYSTKVYSQDGEDIILNEFFSGRNNGFYVDVGAHHPVRFSNTYLFYKKGWHGINIDAMPGSMKRFDKKRKRDINLELGISDKEEVLTYYMFDEPALNGFSTKISTERDLETNYNIIDKKQVKTIQLSKVLDMWLPSKKKIDFMNIDVEGLDLQVLKSNDWNKYIPEFILVECTKDLKEVNDDLVYIFLSNKGYTLVAKTYRTCIFRR